MFIIDVRRCIGCGTCLIACKDRASAPDDVDLLRIESTESGVFPGPQVTHRPVHCFHCAHAPCVGVCPVDALSYAERGLVLLDKEACVGCMHCADACPFGAISALPDGTAIKCDGCVDEVARSLEPTCVRACPMRALAYAPAQDPPPRGRVRDTEEQAPDSTPRVRYLNREPSRGRPTSAVAGGDTAPGNCSHSATSPRKPVQ